MEYIDPRNQAKIDYLNAKIISCEKIVSALSSNPELVKLQMNVSHSPNKNVPMWTLTYNSYNSRQNIENFLMQELDLLETEVQALKIDATITVTDEELLHCFAEKHGFRPENIGVKRGLSVEFFKRNNAVIIDQPMELEHEPKISADL